MPHNTSTMPVPIAGKLEGFEVSQNGFLPEQLPLHRLPGSYYESWELILDHLPSLLSTSSLRSEVDRLEVLSTAWLVSQREWQRAYLILSFLTHAYIWESGGPSEVCLVPFLASQMLIVISVFYLRYQYLFLKWQHISVSHPQQHTLASTSGTTPPSTLQSH